MVKFFNRFGSLPYSALLEIYEGSLESSGRELAPNASEYEQRFLAEQELYTFLSDCFFKTPGAFYALWQEDGHFCSALRMEPYQDGFLLEALETAPRLRKRGFAEMLIRETIIALPHGTRKVYSHIAKSNQASLTVHTRCGFQKILSYARGIDGSVLSDHVTMLYSK